MLNRFCQTLTKRSKAFLHPSPLSVSIIRRKFLPSYLRPVYTFDNMSLPAPDQRLKDFRGRLDHYKVDAFIQGTNDAHHSEYVAERDKRLAYLSCFDGSAGTIVVTANEARLWTDGRYFNQAGKQLSNDWKLMKMGLPDTPSVTKYILNFLTENDQGTKLKYGGRIALDARLFSVSFCNSLNKELRELGVKESIVCLENNPIDEIWGKNQPDMPDAPVFIHDLKYCGVSAKDKISQMQAKINGEKNCFGLIVTSLDHIAWLLNLRGNDIVYNPVFFAYAIVTSNDCHLYIDSKKLKGVTKKAENSGKSGKDESKDNSNNNDCVRDWENDEKELTSHLNDAKVTIHEYNDFFKDLRSMIKENENKERNRFWIDTRKCSFAIADCVPQKLRLLKDDPIELAKSIKNETEINGIRYCHIRDGAAKTKFFAWIEEMKKKDVKLLEKHTEWSFAEKLKDFRAYVFFLLNMYIFLVALFFYFVCCFVFLNREQDLFVDLSFETISSISGNGAIIHYSPSEDNHSKIEANEIYLLDSGGQYLDGTTDVTRTTFLGDLKALNNYKAPKIREYYTRVLKGVIALDSLIFPENSKGPLIDAVARQYLWQIGLDYRHGTGHGVGCFLNVHEGPQGFSASSYRRSLYEYGIRENMLITDEPGYYRDGEFGIRIENVMVAKKHEIPKEEVDKYEKNLKFLTFETITMVPIDKNLMLLDIMTPQEIEWVDTYHQIVEKNLTPYMKQDFEKEFLKQACAPLKKA